MNIDIHLFLQPLSDKCLKFLKMNYVLHSQPKQDCYLISHAI